MPIKGGRISILENSRDAMRDRSKSGFYEGDRGDLFTKTMRNRRNGGAGTWESQLRKTAGFCFGVKRAVEKVYDQIATGKKPIYTYGPIIHNEEVVGDLEKKGVSVIETKEELRQIKEGVIVIRSHGVAKEIYDQIEQQGLECVDATCPFVKRIHNIVEKESANGKQILIIGNAGHPEVEGSYGWCKYPCDGGGVRRRNRTDPM